MGATAVLPNPLPPGRLARDPQWATVLLDAWASDPEIASLPQRGAELLFEQVPYAHLELALHGTLVVDATASGSRPGVIL
ncbi:hypothetical protein T492DRAFT_878470, partial [Pavlovales sp. CCMP2436]